jgi:hypothetical protein
VWGPHLAAASPAAADVGKPAQRFWGPLFAMSTTPSNSRAGVWLACNLTVPYRYEPAPAQPFAVSIRTRKELQQYFAMSADDLGVAFLAEGPVQIEYRVAGRFVLDTATPRVARIVCPAASHHVQTIVVGAYRLAMGDEGDEGSPVRSAARVVTRGHLEDCSTAAGPVEGCRVPLACGFRVVPGHAVESASGLAGWAAYCPLEATMPR